MDNQVPLPSCFLDDDAKVRTFLHAEFTSVHLCTYRCRFVHFCTGTLGNYAYLCGMGSKSIKELGGMYFPDIAAASASRQIVRWMRYNGELWANLLAAGYRPGQRVLTPKQVGLVLAYLGEP